MFITTPHILIYAGCFCLFTFKKLFMLKTNNINSYDFTKTNNRGI